MSSVHKFAPQARAGANKQARTPRNTGALEHKFPRFLAAMAAARRTDPLGEPMPSGDASNSLPLNTAPATTSMQRAKDLWPTMLFGLLCLGMLVLTVVISPRILASLETYLSADGASRRGAHVEGPLPEPNLQVPLIHPMELMKLKDPENPPPSAILPDENRTWSRHDRNPAVDDGAPADDAHPARFGLNIHNLPGDPVEVSFTHVSNAPSGPSAALGAAFQVEARIAEKATASGESRRLTAIEDYRIQLAALSTEASAERMWEELRARYGDILGSKGPLIEPSGRLHLLRAGPFETADQARMTCAQLKRRGAECLLVEPHDS